ncbi:DUF11 domain-containing protein [Candidatus Saccharibacteria bacterium]|nr:DUF11 domain-containing protein [Candidatus Saccharibacteria bacterium]
MFKKLVSNLPFNPGMLNQIAFYGKRLHQEESLRRLSLFFMSGTLLVNLMAVISPAQNTLASSANDIVYGATSKQVIVNALQNGVDTAGRKDIRAIYDFFGITLDDVKNACQVNLYPSSDLQTYNTSQAPGCADQRLKSYTGSLITDGRFMTAQAGNPHYSYIKSAEDKAWLDKPQDIPGTGTRIYYRPLQVWGEWYSTNQVISGYASGNGMLKGKRFWILLKGCGNITFERFNVVPKIEISKSKATPAQTVATNGMFDYRIQYRNSGSATASNVVIEDTLAPEFEFISQSSSDLSFNQSGQKLTWTRPLLPITEWQDIKVTVKARTISERIKTVCNVASILASGIGQVTSSNADNEKCITIDNRCPGTDLIIPDGGVEKCKFICPDGTQVDYDKASSCPVPTALCRSLQIIGSSSWNKRNFQADLELSSAARLESVRLLINDREVKNFGSVDQSTSLVANDVNIGDSHYIAKLAVQAKNGTTYNSGNSCEVDETPVPQFTRISNSKKVRNITQNTDFSSQVNAKAGDVLEYQINVTNSGNIDQLDYVIQPDTLGDVLEYADITQQNDALYNSVDEKLSWPATTIVAGSTVTKSFRVTVKSPIPSTPASLSDPLSFDYKMNNFFGNSVTVDVSKPTPAKIQQNVSALPQTGGESALIFTFIGVLIIAFFYSRTKLLSKEIDVIRYEYSRGGQDL